VDRREFLFGLSALALSPSPRASSLRVDGARLNRRLTELARFGRTKEGGISRVAYSEADREARDRASAWMREAGLAVSVDTAGNLIGRRSGSSDSPPVLFGSHIDSVPDGGNYDGQVGSMAAIEVAHRLAEAGVRTRHPLEVVIFQNEEHGKIGSRAMAGELTGADLRLPTHTEKTVEEGIAFLGGNPSELERTRRKPGEVTAYLELHIEQGGILHRRGIDIGVVEGIVGIERFHVTVEGFANHAGTTPMGERRDAMLTAARIVELVNRVASETPGRQVATVGKLEAHPGAPNVIPGRVQLSLEVRDLDMDKIASVLADVEREARALAAKNGTSVAFDRYYRSRAALMDETLQSAIADAAGELSLSTLSMPSGAGHDAQSVALFAPAGMIFVPSVDGISHSPKEYTPPEDVEAGANLLLHAVLGLSSA
jgi:N-carbamoyl-L-amino-acid hydrolase